MVKEITDENFETEVLEKSKDKPVVVDFWASWCGPCQMLGPIMEKVAEDYKDKVEIVKLSVEQNQSTAAKFNIMSIPSVKMFKDGEVAAEFLGARPESDIKAWLDENL